jgi:hypothetical protein
MALVRLDRALSDHLPDTTFTDYWLLVEGVAVQAADNGIRTVDDVSQMFRRVTRSKVQFLL